MNFSVRFLFFLSILSLYSCVSAQEEEDELGSTDFSWELVWSDEFDYEGLPDKTKWSYDVGTGCPQLCGWGNNELQYYTRDSLRNGRVANGILTIEVHREKIDSSQFSSARLTTKSKGDWKYGRFEIRAKIPSSKGVWSAIWMMPSENTYGNWPKSGEIDIMENVGYDPDTIEASAHTGSYYFTVGTQRHARTSIPDADEVFHDYVLEWDEGEYHVFVDDTCYFTFKNEGTGFMEWPFDQKFHLILNIAYGGNWGGKQGLDSDKLPQRMEVDYVRVYSKKRDKTTSVINTKP